MQSTLPPNNLHKHEHEHGRLGSLISLLVAGLVLAAALFVAFNRQFVLDVYHYWTYQPTSDIAAIAATDGLTDAGKFAFYAARPAINDSQTFNTKCDRTEQSTAILGCYANDRIYLYNVTDSRLNGIKEVTAAHEMLHAVYHRLSTTERARINDLLEAEYKKIEADPAFASRMEYYARTEPGDRDNELHSIIGTEIANISPELEKHYAKYFTDRAKLVAMRDRYEAEFNRLDSRAKELSTQLDKLSKEIDASSKEYNSTAKQLNADIADFNRRATAGEFSSQAVFNSQRRVLQQRVTDLNALRTSIDDSVASYETLRTEYNDTVTQSRKLYQGIDSKLSPAPSVE